MTSIKKDPLMSMLDVRKKPTWELLDLRPDTGYYEHELFESTAAEFTDIAGWTIEYYLQKSENMDHFYGEDPLMQYEGPYRTKITYEPTQEESMIGMFGYQPDDTVQYAEFPKIIFERDVTLQIDETKDIEHIKEYRKPIPGDVIKTLWDGKIYEIAHVNSSEKIFNGKKLVWSLILRPFRYGNEGGTTEDMLFDTFDPNDFPDVNHTTSPMTNEELLSNNIMQDEESEAVDNYEEDTEYLVDDVPTEEYGYSSAKSRFRKNRK